MPRNKLHTALIGLLASALLASGANAGWPRPKDSSSGQARQSNQAPPGAVLCRVLEVKIVSSVRAELVIFHQAHNADGPKLGELLRSRDGAEGQFETPDGKWHAATVLRLATCFGRGMLVLPSARAGLVRKEEFWLKIPVQRGSLGASSP